MNYQETLDFIHSLDKFGSRPGLDRVRALLAYTPEVARGKFIHVAGTNGKGSVCVMLSQILQKSGFRTGLFISPYITEFRERIQINNFPVGRQTLIAAVEYYKPFLEELNSKGIIITEFEFLTVIALYIFKRQDCDYVVCETGMGGLLDSTNIIEKPLCTVITKIDLDHTAILGDTVEEIARQKCGIIKENGVTVSAAQCEAAAAIIRQTAQQMHNTLFLARDIALHDVEYTVRGTFFTYQNEKMFLPLVGAHQTDNLRCVLATVKALNLLRLRHTHISAGAVRDGLKATVHPARFERLREKPAVILDGAHNRNGLEAFTKAVNTFYGGIGKTLVIGMLSDKDDQALSLLKGMFKRIITTDIQNPRALDAEALRQRCRGLARETEVVRNPLEAVDRALSYGDMVFICGSLYLASEIRPHIIEG